MANVSDQQDNWSVFINGLNSLSQTASSIRQSENFNKEIDLKERLAKMKYGQDNLETQTNNLNATTNFLGVLSRIATPEVSTEVANKLSSGLVVNLNPLTAEERRAQANVQVAEVKHQNVVGEIGLKTQGELQETEAKYGHIDQNTKANIGAKLAIAGIAPSQASQGRRGAEEVYASPETVVKPIDEFLSIPKFPIKIGEKQYTFGSKVISTNDFVNSVGSKELMTPYDNQGNTMYTDIQTAQELIKKYPDKKEAIIKGIISKHKELEPLLLQ